MQIYKYGATSITLAGQTFHADERGVIDVPNHLAQNAFSQGFVSAKGRLQMIAVEQAFSPEPVAEPASVRANNQSNKTKLATTE